MLIKKTSFLVLLLFIGAGFAIGQVAGPGFIYGRGKFAVAVTGEPKRERKLFVLSDYRLDGEAFIWSTAEAGSVEVQHFEVQGPDLKVSALAKKFIVDGIRDEFLKALNTTGVTVQHSGFTDRGLSGTEIRAVGERRLITRIFFNDSRVYVVTVIRSRYSFEEASEVMKAFRILSKDEHLSALIKENTPADLPQQRPADASLRPESKHEGLRGKVQSVETYLQELPKGSKQRQSEAYYTDDGWLLKEIEYMEGYPIAVRVWGWIDGKRVSDESDIEYGEGEGPDRKEIIAVMHEAPAAAPEIPKESKRDTRYTYSYKHVYNTSGDLIESRMFQNDGELWLKTVRSYKPGLRENRLYDTEDEISSKQIEVLDAKGNVVETRDYDYQGRLEETRVYTYQFDQTGNWTTRKAFKKIRGKASATPAYVSYREIAYY